MKPKEYTWLLICTICIFLITLFAGCQCGQSPVVNSSSPEPSPEPEPSITVSQETYSSTKAQTLEVTVTVEGVSHTITQEVVNDVIVVNAASGIDESTLSSQLASKGYTIVGKNSATNTYQVSLPSGKTLSQGISDMSEVSAVKNAGTDPITKKELTIPDDTTFKTASKYWAFNQLGMKNVWDLTTGTSEIKVAIVDSGICLSHPEFENRFVHKQNFVTGDLNPDDNEIDSHGSGVAGIAAAVGNNGKFMAGMNWNCKIMPLKVLNDQGEGSSFAAANAISYAAAAGAKVINYSGGNWYNNWSNSSIIEQYQKAAQLCADYGALLICSAGNDNKEVIGASETHYPGGGLKAYANVITVSGIDENGNLTEGTNYGDGVTIAAPGQSITTVLKETSPGEPLIEHTGTSFAAPFVTGLASLIWSINPNLTAAGVKSCIIDGADQISNTKNIGYKINAWNSILKALEYKSSGVIAVKSNPSGGSISIDGTDKGKVTTSEGYTYLEATEGSHTVSVSKSGYTTSSETVSVTKGAVKYSDLTLGGAEPETGMITGDTSTYLNMDNGKLWIRSDYTSSITRTIINQIGLHGQSTNWLNRGIGTAPCLTQSTSSLYDGIKDHSISIVKNTSSISAYKTQFTAYYGSKELRVTWKFIAPKDKDYLIWVASFESIGSDKDITVDNAVGEAIQDVYFMYPIQPTPESGSYVSWECKTAVAWSSASTDPNDPNSNNNFNSSNNRYFCIYNLNGCFSFGFLSPNSTDPYQFFLNTWMGYSSVCSTIKKVTLSTSSPSAQWIGVLAFHSSVADAKNIYNDAKNNLSSYLEQIR